MNSLYNFDSHPDRRISSLEGGGLVGEYRGEFRRTPDGWRFSRRDIQVGFLRGAEV